MMPSPLHASRCPSVRQVRLPAAHPQPRERLARQQPRASHLLRNFLSENAAVDTFTVERIVAGLEHGGAAARLMVFSLPSLVPIPGTEKLVGLPGLAVASSLIRGHENLRLPSSVLKREVPRRALALAIHAILPILQRAERKTKARWSWLSTPAARRVIGVLVFLLALPLALPILGFSLPHAASMFTIALGMIERDGALVAIGSVAGIAALVFVTARSLAPDVLGKRILRMGKDLLRRLTSFGAAAEALIRYLRRQLSIRLLSGRPTVKGPAPKPRRLVLSPVASQMPIVATGTRDLVGI